MSITFNYNTYIYEHEKAPRGFGKWAFIIDIEDKRLTELDLDLEHYEDRPGWSLVWASTTMTLVDAKKELKDKLKGFPRPVYAKVAP